MLSVIIPTDNDAQALAALLMALAPAAIDGLVREVIAADAGSTDQTLESADDAGVDVVSGGLVAAAGLARNPWVLVLPIQIRLRHDWAARLSVHLGRGPQPGLLKGVRAWFGPVGLLVTREALLTADETREVASLVRSLGRGATRV